MLPVVNVEQERENVTSLNEKIIILEVKNRRVHQGSQYKFFKTVKCSGMVGGIPYEWKKDILSHSRVYCSIHCTLLKWKFLIKDNREMMMALTVL